MGLYPYHIIQNPHIIKETYMSDEMLKRIKGRS
jgi:hypothetical protein